MSYYGGGGGHPPPPPQFSQILRDPLQHQQVASGQGYPPHPGGIHGLPPAQMYNGQGQVPQPGVDAYGYQQQQYPPPEGPPMGYQPVHQGPPGPGGGEYGYYGGEHHQPPAAPTYSNSVAPPHSSPGSGISSFFNPPAPSATAAPPPEHLAYQQRQPEPDHYNHPAPPPAAPADPEPASKVQIMTGVVTQITSDAFGMISEEIFFQQGVVTGAVVLKVGDKVVAEAEPVKGMPFKFNAKKVTKLDLDLVATRDETPSGAAGPPPVQQSYQQPQTRYEYAPPKLAPLQLPSLPASLNLPRPVPPPILPSFMPGEVAQNEPKPLKSILKNRNPPPPPIISSKASATPPISSSAPSNVTSYINQPQITSLSSFQRSQQPPMSTSTSSYMNQPQVTSSSFQRTQQQPSSSSTSFTMDLDRDIPRVLPGGPGRQQMADDFAEFAEYIYIGSKTKPKPLSFPAPELPSTNYPRPGSPQVTRLLPQSDFPKEGGKEEEKVKVKAKKKEKKRNSRSPSPKKSSSSKKRRSRSLSPLSPPAQYKKSSRQSRSRSRSRSPTRRRKSSPKSSSRRSRSRSRSRSHSPRRRKSSPRRSSRRSRSRSPGRSRRYSRSRSRSITPRRRNSRRSRSRSRSLSPREKRYPIYSRYSRSRSRSRSNSRSRRRGNSRSPQRYRRRSRSSSSSVKSVKYSPPRDKVKVLAKTVTHGIVVTKVVSDLFPRMIDREEDVKDEASLKLGAVRKQEDFSKSKPSGGPPVPIKFQVAPSSSASAKLNMGVVPTVPNPVFSKAPPMPGGPPPPAMLLRNPHPGNIGFLNYTKTINNSEPQGKKKKEQEPAFRIVQNTPKPKPTPAPVQVPPKNQNSAHKEAEVIMNKMQQWEKERQQLKQSIVSKTAVNPENKSLLNDPSSLSQLKKTIQNDLHQLRSKGPSVESTKSTTTQLLENPTNILKLKESVQRDLSKLKNPSSTTPGNKTTEVPPTSSVGSKNQTEKLNEGVEQALKTFRVQVEEKQKAGNAANKNASQEPKQFGNKVAPSSSTSGVNSKTQAPEKVMRKPEERNPNSRNNPTNPVGGGNKSSNSYHAPPPQHKRAASPSRQNAEVEGYIDPFDDNAPYDAELEKIMDDIHRQRFMEEEQRLRSHNDAVSLECLLYMNDRRNRKWDELFLIRLRVRETKLKQERNFDELSRIRDQYGPPSDRAAHERQLRDFRLNEHRTLPKVQLDAIRKQEVEYTEWLRNEAMARTRSSRGCEGRVLRRRTPSPGASSKSSGAAGRGHPHSNSLGWREHGGGYDNYGGPPNDYYDHQPHPHDPRFHGGYGHGMYPGEGYADHYPDDGHADRYAGRGDYGRFAMPR